AAYTVIGPGLLGVPVLAGKGAFRTRLASNVILLVGKLLAPFCLRFDHFLSRLVLHSYPSSMFCFRNDWMFENLKSGTAYPSTSFPTFRYFPLKNSSGSPSRTTTSSTSAMKIV